MLNVVPLARCWMNLGVNIINSIVTINHHHHTHDHHNAQSASLLLDYKCYFAMMNHGKWPSLSISWSSRPDHDYDEGGWSPKDSPSQVRPNWSHRRGLVKYKRVVGGTTHLTMFCHMSSMVSKSMYYIPDKWRGASEPLSCLRNWESPDAEQELSFISILNKNSLQDISTNTK